MRVRIIIYNILYENLKMCIKDTIYSGGEI